MHRASMMCSTRHDMKNMWTRNQGDYTVRDIGRWSSPPPDTMWARWFGGIITPVLILWPALYVIITKTGFIPGRHRSRLDLHGTDTVLFGCVLVCLSLFLHTHYFWGTSRRLMQLHETGKTVTLLGFCVFLVWLLIRLFTGCFG